MQSLRRLAGTCVAQSAPQAAVSTLPIDIQGYILELLIDSRQLTDEWLLVLMAAVAAGKAFVAPQQLITDVGLEALCDYTGRELTKLDISGCLRITEWRKLRDLSNLLELDISGCEVDDTTLGALEELKLLRRLNIKNCCNITHAAVRSLLKALDDIEDFQCDDKVMLNTNAYHTSNNYYRELSESDSSDEDLQLNKRQEFLDWLRHR